MTQTGADEIREHMQRLYGEFTRAEGLPKLNPEKIPAKLGPWIPYAEFWGIAEDFDREELVRQASHEIQEDLVQLIQRLDDDWMNGWQAMNRKTVVSLTSTVHSPGCAWQPTMRWFA